MSYYNGVESLFTPVEARVAMGRRVRELRLARNWRLATLAERAGVGVATLQRFETSGRITLDNLLKVADALGRLAEVEQLFRPPVARSLDQLARASAAPRPRRGRK